jgi:hypothetical protein
VFKLIGPDGQPYLSAIPGTLGGHRRLKGYGRLDCPSALRWIAAGHYVRHRVFFAEEADAVAAGYRPCARCLPERYAIWKADPPGFSAPPSTAAAARAWPGAGSGRGMAPSRAASTIEPRPSITR